MEGRSEIESAVKGASKSSQRLDSTGGFALVLAGLKAFLEHNILLKLVVIVSPKDLENTN